MHTHDASAAMLVVFSVVFVVSVSDEGRIKAELVFIICLFLVNRTLR